MNNGTRPQMQLLTWHQSTANYLRRLQIT